MVFKSYIEYKNSFYQQPGYGDIADLQATDGVITAIYQRLTNPANDASYSNIWQKYSVDGGKNWLYLNSPPAPLQPNIGLQNTGWVSLVKLATGSWSMFFLVKNATPTDLEIWKNTTTDPYTSPFIAANAIKVPSQTAGYNVLQNNAVRVLASGRVIIPIAWLNGSVYNFYVLYSDDNGTTWTASAKYTGGGSLGLLEPGIVELTPGNLLAYFRTDTGFVYTSTSANNGNTWTAPAASTLPSTNLGYGSPSKIILLSTGKLLAATNPPGIPGDSIGRAVLRLSKSADNGATWTTALDLEPVQFQPGDMYNFEYAAMMQSANGSLPVYLAYLEQINAPNGPGSQKFAYVDLTDIGE